MPEFTPDPGILESPTTEDLLAGFRQASETHGQELFSNLPLNPHAEAERRFIEETEQARQRTLQIPVYRQRTLVARMQQSRPAVQPTEPLAPIIPIERGRILRETRRAQQAQRLGRSLLRPSR